MNFFSNKIKSEKYNFSDNGKVEVVQNSLE